MKKILISILLLFIPFIVSAQNVTIKSIKLVEKGEYVEEIEQAKYDGLKVSFNLKFNEVGDYATYLVTIKNGDNEDYKLNTTPNTESSYITYEFDTQVENDVIKANSENKVYITAKYTKEVPASALVNNKYTETKQIGLSLVSTEPTKEIVNPNTGNVIKIGKFTIPVHTIGIICVATILAIVVIKNKKVMKYSSYVLLLGLLIIPTTILAIKEIKIDIETTIEIEKIITKKTTVVIYDNNYDEPREVEIEYVEGMTWEEWEKSKYNKKKLHLIEEAYDNQDNCVVGYGVFNVNTGTGYNPNPSPRSVQSSSPFATYEADGSPGALTMDSAIQDNTNYILYYNSCEVEVSLQSNGNGGQTFSALAGMTFGAWLDSSYNTDNVSFVDYTTIPNYEEIELGSGQTLVSYSDTVNPEYEYEVITVTLNGHNYDVLVRHILK